MYAARVKLYPRGVSSFELQPSGVGAVVSSKWDSLKPSVRKSFIAQTPRWLIAGINGVDAGRSPEDVARELYERNMSPWDLGVEYGLRDKIIELSYGRNNPITEVVSPEDPRYDDLANDELRRMVNALSSRERTELARDDNELYNGSFSFERDYVGDAVPYYDISADVEPVASPTIEELLPILRESSRLKMREYRRANKDRVKGWVAKWNSENADRNEMIDRARYPVSVRQMHKMAEDPGQYYARKKGVR
jgi:hypothetical protein